MLPTSPTNIIRGGGGGGGQHIYYVKLQAPLWNIQLLLWMILTTQSILSESQLN